MTAPSPASGSSRSHRRSTPAARPAGKPQQAREKFIWTPEAIEPPAGVDYTRVLSGPPQRAALTVGGLVAVVLSYQLVYPVGVQLMLLIGFLVRGGGGTLADYSTRAIAYEYPEGMLAVHVGIALFIPVVLLLVRWMHQRSPRWLVSVQPGPRVRYLLMGLVISGVVLGLASWASGDQDLHWSPTPQLAWWLVVIVVTSPLQAAAEEFMFRGYLSQVLGAVIANKWVVIVLSSAVFAIFHGTQNLPLLVNRFAFGLLMGTLVVLTGGLEAAIAAHVMNNLLAWGLAAISGGVADLRALQTTSWTSTAWSLAAYALAALAMWWLGRALRVATRTPAQSQPGHRTHGSGGDQGTPPRLPGGGIVL